MIEVLINKVIPEKVLFIKKVTLSDREFKDMYSSDELESLKTHEWSFSEGKIVYHHKYVGD